MRPPPEGTPTLGVLRQGFPCAAPWPCPTWSTTTTNRQGESTAAHVAGADHCVATHTPAHAVHFGLHRHHRKCGLNGHHTLFGDHKAAGFQSGLVAVAATTTSRVVVVVVDTERRCQAPPKVLHEPLEINGQYVRRE